MKISPVLRRTLCLMTTGLMMLVELSVTGAYAQGVPDATPPVIEHERLEQSTATGRQVFTAQVVDDRDLRDVTLYHRRSGEAAYSAVAMASLADSAFYSASVPTDPQDLRRIEYYLQARDTGGNRTVSGFAFDPWVRDIVAPASQPVTAAGSTTASATTRADAAQAIGIGGVSWWKIALGVVAVGTLAALAGGGSGGSADTADAVPFTLTLGEPR